MQTIKRTFIIFTLLCISTATAYNQDCNSYLQRAETLYDQNKYCEAKKYYLLYSKCNADIDVSTEIAMCEKRCRLNVMEGVETETADEPEEVEIFVETKDVSIPEEEVKPEPVSTPTSSGSHKVKPEKRRSGGYSSLPVPSQGNTMEFSIFGGGGLSFMAYQSAPVKTSSVGYNYDVGIGFTGFVSQQCGFHVGVGFGQFQVKANVGDIKNLKSGLTDSNGKLFDLHSTLYDYSEIQKTMSLYFPLMVQLQAKEKQGKTANYYAMLGVKVHVLLSRAYSSEITALANAAYYPDAHNWATTQTFAGLGEFSGDNSNGKLDVGVLAMFAFETGAKFRIGKIFCLYAGAYFDLGLNDPTKNKRNPVGNFTTVESLYNLSLLDVYKNSFLMDVGIKLRFALTK